MSEKREDLHRAVDLFITRQRIKLHREDTKRMEWQTLPSLWEQLETSAMWSGQGTGNGAFGGRPVISLGVVDLLMEVAAATSETVVEFAEKSRLNVPANLRAIAAALPEDFDLLTTWTGMVTGWTSKAREVLRLEPPHPKWARGISCPECGADTAMADRNGESVRTPALAITWTPPDREEHQPDSAWKVRAVECRSCSATWWRGDSMEHLVDAMLIANQTRETMTLPETA